MDSQPSGDNELISIETEKIIFVLKGERYGISDEAIFKIDLFCKELHEADAEYIKGLYLKEYTNYEIIIQSKNDAVIDFYHENINIRNKVTPITSKSKNLSGVIDFRGDIGITNLLVNVNNKPELEITLEVYPSKISYKEDYKAILNDVSEEIYNLAYGFLARTYLSSEINNKTNNNNSEFYSILNYVFDKLKKSIDIILYNPYHELQKESKIVKYYKIKNASNETIKYLEKRPYLMEKVNDRYLPKEALITKKNVTTNTKENRFLKFMLLKIINKIDKFILKYQKGNNNDIDVLNKLSTFKKEINKRINASILRNIPSEFNEANLSLVFSMGNGYKEVYKYYLMLQKGLSISSNIFSLSMKELSLLYEYWCFIKINSLLKKKYKLVSSDFLKINKDGITVLLTKGAESSLTYENPQTNEKFKVYYNSLRSSKTVSQKPDNILSMHKEGCEKSYEFIFDAKYKIETSQDYIQRYGSIGPKEEDINTMHRYRDAIIYDYNKDKLLERKDKIKNPASFINNCIFGAFVLFPYNHEEEFKNNTFYKSIEEVNIGAIPFLPSTTKLMEDFLDEIIDESSYSSFERAIEPVGKDDYLKDEYFSKREVLVGSLKNKEQMEVNIKYNFYHIPKSKINLAKNNIKYIALYQSKSEFHDAGGILWYGKIKNINPVKRNEIYELPKADESLYYKFEIEEWRKLENKIEISNHPIRNFIYTTFYFLNNASSITELCIKRKDEFRLFIELKRRYSEVSILTDSSIDAKSEIKAFNIDDVKIIVDDENIMSVIGEKVIRVTKEEFLKRQMKSIKRLLIKE
ncbi:DUF2357 domain-containing protein [Clostridium chromiireducens]|uniref:DUF2357 domain-containing protein n=1 Tax=Clostridium chromiireducens TaxID=225345 RepID=A0A399IIY0_9CLOT|nr:DUF2357 domain-containing protein [Clostridium chromiireducens]RII32964.1 DUF2357 domain-containing protein [Clostridium chromiireducens]